MTHQPRKQRPLWPIEVSVFYDYITKEEDPELIKKCFEKDWSDMKKLKYKKGTEKEIKEQALHFYKVIKQAYRVQAGLGNAGSVFSVPLN